MHSDLAIRMMADMFWTGLLVCLPILGLVMLVGLRKDPGRGQLVEVATSDVALILCSPHVTGHLWNGWHLSRSAIAIPSPPSGVRQRTRR